MTADRIFGLAFIALAAGMFLAIYGAEAPFAGLGDPGPKLLPYFLSVGLGLIGFLLALRKGPAPRAAVAGPEGQAEEKPAGGETVAPPAVSVRLSLGVALIAYVAVFERFGFTPATFLFLALAMVVLGPRTLRGAAISIGLAAVLTLIVGSFLGGVIGVPLPGVWLF